MKGYKVFNSDWTCLNQKYEVGKEYEITGKMVICKNGFHFCKHMADCFNYYSFDLNNKVAEIEALGEVIEDGNKCCTDKIKIIREISWLEVLNLVNTGKNCTGLRNSGSCNSGYRNSGYRNSGDYNSGSYNSGDCNSGYRNSGDYNSGDYNSGSYNSGDYNSGYRNSGYRNSGSYNSGSYNSGDYNSGYYNSGYRNSGSYNSGSYNSGDYNSGYYNSGCFNTKNQKLRFFDIETDYTFEEWRQSNACYILNKIKFNPTIWVNLEKMTEDEKTKYPESKTLGGYLKKQDLKNCYTDWWKSITENEKKTIKNIPNFNADKFCEITGIDRKEV